MRILIPIPFLYEVSMMPTFDSWTFELLLPVVFMC